MGRLTSFVFVVVCAAICASSFHGCWLKRQLDQPRVFRGYFEASHGNMGLAFSGDAPSLGMSFPSPGPNADGRYGVPPGTVVAIPLRDGVEYVVSGALPGLLPYVLIGDLGALPPDCPDLVEQCGDGMSFDAPSQLVADAGGAAFVPWRSGRPWILDEAWLKELASACSARDGEISLSRHADRVRARVGSCTADRPVGTDSVLAVLAGPSFSFIRTDPPVWKFDRQMRRTPLAITAGLGALAALAALGVFGVNGAVALVVGIVGLGLWDPFVVRFGAMLLGLALLVVWLLMLVGRRLGGRAVLVCVGVGVAGVAALFFYLVELRPERTPLPPLVRESSAANPTCLVTGYSTAHGEGTRERGAQPRFDPSGGMNDLLNRSCPPCRQRTMTIAEGGETFLFVRNAVCGDVRLARPGTVVFLGGANDDLLGWRDSQAPAFEVFGRLATGLVSLNRGDFDADKLFALWDRASAASLTEISRHLDLIREAVRCAHARGERFVFVNNFIVTDLPRGRSPTRQKIADARRIVVEEEGGVFLDLFEAIGASAGVASFDDFVHPSLEMHRRIAAVVCRLLEENGPASARPGS
jgi:hypothetical protein